MTDSLPLIRSAVERGFTPLPLLPRSKRPAVPDWTSLKSSDSAKAFQQVRDRLSAEGEALPLNVGLLLGNGLVDIDLDHHRAVTLARRMLPPTDMKHGRASSRHSHWWYRIDDYPLGIKSYRLPTTDGRVGQTIIEYRATGGQTMIPPSVHPESKEPLLWEGEEFGGVDGPAVTSGKDLHARVALIAMIVTLAEAWPRRGGRHDAYLALVGGLLRDEDDEGNPRLQPFWAGHQIESLVGLLADLTHDEDGADSRIQESVASTRRKIMAGSKVRGWPTLARMMGESGEVFTSTVREIAAEVEGLLGMPRNKLTRRKDEDEWWDHADPRVTSIEAATPNEEGPTEIVIPAGPGSDDEEEQRGTWQIVTQHDRWLDENHRLTSPIVPGIVFREDGVGLMYPGRVNMIYGPSGSGKTLIAMASAVSELARGGRVLMVDLENGYDEMHERLQALGLPAGMRTPGWAYIEAEQPMASLQRDSWGGEETSPTGRLNRERFLTALHTFDPTFILVDGTTTLFTMHGLDPNKATGVDTITSWLRRICEHGKRTALLIDHTNKNPKVGDLPTGSQHKKSMVQGTMLQVHGESPEVGETTHSMLFATKDRPGKVRRDGFKQADGDIRVADILFESEDDGRIKIRFTEPDPEAVMADLSSTRPPGRPKADRSPDDAAVLSAVASGGAGTLMTRAEIEDALPHPIPQGRVRESLSRLVESGRIERHGVGRSTSYTAP